MPEQQAANLSELRDLCTPWCIHVAATGVAGRVTMAGQSFFDPLPSGADLYLLRGVLNDWPDREAVAILTRCAGAARPGPQSSGYFVVECRPS
jgi:hypothetical protein